MAWHGSRRRWSRRPSFYPRRRRYPSRSRWTSRRSSYRARPRVYRRYTRLLRSTTRYIKKVTPSNWIRDFDFDSGTYIQRSLAGKDKDERLFVREVAKANLLRAQMIRAQNRLEAMGANNPFNMEEDNGKANTTPAFTPYAQHVAPPVYHEAPQVEEHRMVVYNQPASRGLKRGRQADSEGPLPKTARISDERLRLTLYQNDDDGNGIAPIRSVADDTRFNMVPFDETRVVRRARARAEESRARVLNTNTFHQDQRRRYKRAGDWHSHDRRKIRRMNMELAFNDGVPLAMDLTGYDSEEDARPHRIPDQYYMDENEFVDDEDERRLGSMRTDSKWRSAEWQHGPKYKPTLANLTPLRILDGDYDKEPDGIY